MDNKTTPAATPTTTTTTTIPINPGNVRSAPQPPAYRLKRFTQQQQQQQLLQQQQQQQRFISGNIFQMQAPQPSSLGMQISPADSSMLNFPRNPMQQIPQRLMNQTPRQLRPQQMVQQQQQHLHDPQQQQQQQQQQPIRTQMGRGGPITRNMRGGRGGVTRGNF